MFDVPDAAGVMMELAACRKAKGGGHYIRMNAFDNSHGWESVRLSFITDRPANELGFKLTRTEGAARQTIYSTAAYSAEKPEGARYG